jgi:GH25 family lysozyme M1 (1,4-beta-N-acetylmuramidase)
LDAAAMVRWIRDFSYAYRSFVYRFPVIYTTTDWWKNCTGNSPALASKIPLWIADYASSIGPLPNGWNSYTFWQFAESGSGNQNYFNGDRVALRK